MKSKLIALSTIASIAWLILPAHAEVVGMRNKAIQITRIADSADTPTIDGVLDDPL